jgi:hypothetical protein
MFRRPSTRNRAERMRFAVDAMPRFAREAMLRGIDDNEIIAGAYVDSRSGGVCPMLAAHRNGGRTTFLSFARSWDQFSATKRVRRATERELAILEDLLEASLLKEQDAVDLGAAIADHQATKRRRETTEIPEITARRLKPGRLKLGDYERAFERLEALAAAETVH